jgi:NAD+ kinase
MRVVILGNPNKTERREAYHLLIKSLKQYDFQIAVENNLYDVMSRSMGIDTAGLQTFRKEDCHGDLALSVGGDGTLLNTAAYIGEKNIPILGINMGRLGFLTDVSTDELSQFASYLKDKRYKIEHRTVLEAACDGNTLFSTPFALNEIAILKQDLSSLISVRTNANGEYLHTYEADGLIISTPTGSTAYSLSAGGPIMIPETNNLIITPIASHSLNVRPLIVPDNWEIELDVRSRSHSYLISLDGRSTTMNEGSKIKIKKADHKIQIVRLENYSFIKSLRAKLMWGADIRK